jgi:hypothetical protein
MAKTQTIFKQKTVTDELPSLSGRAIDNLQFIRETMERSTHFTAVPGYGGALMGVTAIAASIIASFQINYRLWLMTWLIEAVLAFAIGLLTMWQKSKTVNTPLTSAPARKFARGFVPPLVAGIILTALLYFNSLFQYLPCVWLTLYGTAVVTGGAYSVKAVPTMGWIFIALGLAAVFVPTIYGDWLMGLGFGVLHIVFGLIIARRFGG